MPAGKGGNHRTGKSRGTPSGSRRGTLRADKDPLIIARRAQAAPLWIRGASAIQVLERINAWLELQGELPIVLRTIYKDYEAITAGWAEDYVKVAAKARAAHLARLNRVVREAFQEMDGARSEGKRMEVLRALDRIIRADEAMAKVDGTNAAGTLKGVRDSGDEEGGEEILERVYFNVSLADLA